MKNRILFLFALLSAFTVTRVVAQSVPPVLVDNITEIDVSDGTISPFFTVVSGGSNYSNAFPPTVTISGGGGTGAFGVPVIDDATGQVTGIFLFSGGHGYIGDPTVTITGGTNNPQPSGTPPVTPPTQASTGAEVTGYLNFPLSGQFVAPFQNEIYGPAGMTILIWSLASGTHPASGFSYDIKVNGLGVGTTTPAAQPGTPGGLAWTPPLPGVYSIVSHTTDGANNATSQAIRYFATGTAIVSPVAGGTPPVNGGQGNQGPGTLVPVGSTIVVQATSTPPDGFVQRIDFYTDWTGSTTTSTLIGTAKDYPYSVIYTPAGPSGATHIVKAVAYDNNGAVVASSASMDQITLTMTTPNPAAPPTCTILTPASQSLVEIPDYASSASAGIPVIVTAGAAEGASISKVELYVNGVLLDTDNSYPYTFNWQPTVTGTFNLTALAYDNLGNVVASTTSTSATATPAPTTVHVESAPAVAIISPGNGSALNSGAPTSLTAVASDTDLDANGNPASITQVQFFQDGTFLGVVSSPTSGDEFTLTFKPVQNLVNGVPAPSELTAIASDTLGFTGLSPSVQVTVTSGGTGSNVVIGTPPTVALTAPLDGTSVVVNTPIKLSASGTAPNGNIASVSFLVDNAVVTTLDQYPYSTTWTFQNLGSYKVVAQVVDNLGDKVQTLPITVNVVPEPPPVIAITAPASGGIVNAASGITVTASATSPSGTIASVQFYENNISIGTATSAPYTASFTPLSAGVYTLIAVATDNSGEQSTSAPSIVEAVPASGGLGTTTYFGTYLGITGDSGVFAFAVVDGTFGTFISRSNSSPASIAYYPDLKVSSGGNFSGAHLTGGTASVTGVSGTLVPSNDLFIGASSNSIGQSVASGYYTGSLAGQAASTVTAIVGADANIMVYVSSGSFSDVGAGTVDATGAFMITTAGNNSLTGTADPATGFMTGAISGPSAGSILAARVSGGTFSDGVLRNISTRGTVGSGAASMIAGFVVGGTSPKQLMIRAIGPTLSYFGVSGAVSATQLDVYTGSTLVAANTGWSSTPSNTVAVSSAEPVVGAFALPNGSADSAVVGSYAPGNYTAVVSGVGTATGIALVEVWDLDTYQPFTTQKLINVSTRGTVGTGSNVMIGGFKVNGAAPKRLLIRGAGPGLTALGVSGALATPHLQLVDSTTQAVIRENFSWGLGNDASLVMSAEQASGAFPFAPGSADSVILIVLPPGTYTAILSGVGSSTGAALTEVYEVP